MVAVAAAKKASETIAAVLSSAIKAAIIAVASLTSVADALATTQMADGSCSCMFFVIAKRCCNKYCCFTCYVSGYLSNVSDMVAISTKTATNALTAVASLGTEDAKAAVASLIYYCSCCTCYNSNGRWLLQLHVLCDCREMLQ